MHTKSMSLTSTYLQDIRYIVEDAVAPLKNELKVLRNDIKEFYEMIADLQSKTITDKSFRRRTLEQRILTLHTELLAAAKQAGVTLPR